MEFSSKLLLHEVVNKLNGAHCKSETCKFLNPDYTLFTLNSVHNGSKHTDDKKRPEIESPKAPNWFTQQEKVFWALRKTFSRVYLKLVTHSPQELQHGVFQMFVVSVVKEQKKKKKEGRKKERKKETKLESSKSGGNSTITSCVTNFHVFGFISPYKSRQYRKERRKLKTFCADLLAFCL